MVRLNRLTAGYLGTPVVREVSMEFTPGAVTVLLGPNGSGKSTLLRAALGLLPPMDGQVLYDGVELRRLSRREVARQAAFLTQGRDTPSIQALRMVLHGRFPYLSYPRRYSKRDYDLARRAMDATDSRQYEQDNVHQLSGGQRQSVYLAMALTQDTKTVFMDEPTTYLDIRHQLSMMETAHALAQDGKAVVLVLHDLALALREADRVALMNQGKLLCCDTPEAVYRSGLPEQVFGVAVHRADTPHGVQYYCVPKEA